MKWGRVEAPWWDDKPVVIVAEGPSRKGFDLEPVRGKCYVLAVKGSMFEFPWADAGFGIDVPRYKEWQAKIAELPMRVYWGADIDRTIEPKENVTVLKRSQGLVFCEESDSVAVGGTSGYAAINAAVHKRGKELYLLGYDYQPMTEWHVNEELYRGKRTQNKKNWQTWAEKYEKLAPVLTKKSIKVWNVSPDSRIDAFPKISFDEFLSRFQ